MTTTDRFRRQSRAVQWLGRGTVEAALTGTPNPVGGLVQGAACCDSAREKNAPPPAHGVRTREGRNLLRPLPGARRPGPDA